MQKGIHYFKNKPFPHPIPECKGRLSAPDNLLKKGQSDNPPFLQVKLARLQIPPNTRTHFSDDHATISGKALLCQAVSDLHSKKQVS